MATTSLTLAPDTNAYSSAQLNTNTGNFGLTSNTPGNFLSNLFPPAYAATPTNPTGFNPNQNIAVSNFNQGANNYANTNPQPPSATAGGVAKPPTNTGGGGGGGSQKPSNNQSSVGYAPTFAGQTVGINGRTYRSDANGNWIDVTNEGVQGISQEDIDNAFNPVYSTIDQLKSNALGNQQTYLNAATSPFEALRPDIDQAFTAGSNLNQNQTAQNNTQTQNALAAARQLYDELTRGVNQRFGGTSSAGDFARAFYGRELQKNEGAAYQTQGQNQQTLATQMANLQSQHDNNIKQLEAQKASALSNAQLQFQQRLDQIDQLRLQTDQQKASAKLDALQQLKATANAINQQFTQFQQNLQLQNQSALDQLRNSVATAQAYSGQPINLSAIAPFVSSTIGGGQNTTNPYFVTGSTGQRIDPLTGRPIQ